CVIWFWRVFSCVLAASCAFCCELFSPGGDPAPIAAAVNANPATVVRNAPLRSKPVPQRGFRRLTGSMNPYSAMLYSAANGTEPIIKVCVVETVDLFGT